MTSLSISAVTSTRTLSASPPRGRTRPTTSLPPWCPRGTISGRSVPRNAGGKATLTGSTVRQLLHTLVLLTSDTITVIIYQSISNITSPHLTPLVPPQPDVALLVDKLVLGGQTFESIVGYPAPVAEISHSCRISQKSILSLPHVRVARRPAGTVFLGGLKS